MPDSTRTSTLPPRPLHQRTDARETNQCNDKDRLASTLAARFMSAAAQVWGVAELASLVCAWSYAHPSESSIAQPRLANLARVSKFVSDAALRQLWRDLPSMRPLLSLLPSDLVELHFAAEWNPATSPLPVVKRSPVSDDFNSYLRYAALVHSIKSSGAKRACFLPSSLFELRVALYADQNGNLWPFPRLQELQLDLALREDQIRPILHLINPFLQSITLTFVGDEDDPYDPYAGQDVCQLTSAVRMTCLSLKTFALNGLHCGPTWLHSTGAIADFLYTAPLQNLVLYARHSALLPLFALLSKRSSHQLKLLHLVAAYHDSDPLPECDEGPFSLPTLDQLAVETDHTLLCRQLSFGTLPQAPNLRTLRCLLTDFADEETDLRKLFAAIAQYARSDAPVLQELVVTAQPHEAFAYLLSPPTLRAAALRPLTVLAHVKHVEIELGIFCQVTTQLLDAFVHAWGQHLECLVLSPCPYFPVDEHDIRIGLEDVIVFAAHCPHMHTLGILFTENEGPIYEYFPQSMALRTLVVGSSPIFSVAYCTEVLTKGFPKLKTLHWSDPGTFVSTCGDYDERWEQVESRLGLC